MHTCDWHLVVARLTKGCGDAAHTSASGADIAAAQHHISEKQNALQQLVMQNIQAMAKA